MISVRLVDGDDEHYEDDSGFHYRYDIRQGHLLVLRYDAERSSQRFVVTIYAPGGWLSVRGLGLADPGDPEVEGQRRLLLQDFA